LVFASFSDLFSSSAALDPKGTTMYRDDAATAFLFPPHVEWKEVSPSSVEEGAGGGALSVIGHQSLVAKGTVLTLNGAVVEVPRADGEVTSITAEPLGGKWVVGVVRKIPPSSLEGGVRGGEYAGYAYFFDGRTFTPIFLEDPERSRGVNGGKAFTSDYPGVWGFGGISEDFLAVYGAYQGRGFHIRNPKATGLPKITDISWLFDVRVMKGGIEPGIVRVPLSPSLEGGGVTWYVFNQARNNRPVFLKLFQNGTDDIVGEANLLGTAPQGFSYFTLFPSSDEEGRGVVGGISLSASAESNGIPSAWEIRDKGFKIPSAPVTITSANLNNYADAEVPHILKLGVREFSSGGAAIKMQVSNGGEWESALSSVESHCSPSSAVECIFMSNYWFKNPHGKELHWRATVTPGTNPEFSPFIGIVDLDYEVKRNP
jgi:hypothetical protein